MVQLIIAAVLACVLIFGIGFILNMLLKTTWFPIYFYIAFLLGTMLYIYGFSGFFDNLEQFKTPDYVPALTGLVGAYLSGLAIKALRDKGYKMF